MTRASAWPTVLRILLVENREADAILIHEMLAKSPTVKTEWIRAHTLEEALRLMADSLPSVIILDLSLPDSQGIETIRRLYPVAGDAPILVLTGVADDETGAEAVKQGAQEYLVKGEVEPRGLLRAIRYALERKRTEAQLRAALHEKEVLLREVHHRVKNNLQIIASLLRLGGERVKDHKAREIFRDSHGRIRSIALIHERLYLAGDLARVPFREYLRSLTRELFSVQNAWSRGIQLGLDVDDTTLTLDVAIPCGLIIHELVNNALEHAFPNDENADDEPAAEPPERRIDVGFRHLESGGYALRVADNGVGLPTAAELAKRKSLGLELVDTLVRQVGGTLNRDRGPGCTVTIVFAERSTR